MFNATVSYFKIVYQFTLDILNFVSLVSTVNTHYSLRVVLFHKQENKAV